MRFPFARPLSAAAPQVALAADPTLPVFPVGNFAAPVANPCFSLKVGTSRTLKGNRTDCDPIEEFAALTVQGPGPVILGVPTVPAPDLREFKYYAPGIGLIRADEEMSEAHDNPAIIVELQP